MWASENLSPQLETFNHDSTISMLRIAMKKMLYKMAKWQKGAKLQVGAIYIHFSFPENSFPQTEKLADNLNTKLQG